MVVEDVGDGAFDPSAEVSIAPIEAGLVGMDAVFAASIPMPLAFHPVRRQHRPMRNPDDLAPDETGQVCVGTIFGERPPPTPDDLADDDIAYAGSFSGCFSGSGVFSGAAGLGSLVSGTGCLIGITVILRIGSPMTAIVILHGWFPVGS